jgi:hypothetical protein
MTTFRELAREIPVVEEADVIVCGGGPAGTTAAVAAARTGAKTVLFDVHGCLGGVWTAGALSWIIDASNKAGIMAEIVGALDARNARAGRSADFAYDVEAMKLVLDRLALEAGVSVQLHTRVVAAYRDERNRLSTVVTESKSGREAWLAHVFIDATGDGDVAAQAGCGFDLGHPETGQTQPMSLMALLTGIELDEVDAFVAGGLETTTTDPDHAARFRDGTLNLLSELRRAGVEPSYTRPTLCSIYADLFALMANHQYGASAIDARDVSSATMRARSEIDELVTGLRSLGRPWDDLRVVATGAQIGVREGRRIHGRYQVTEDDLVRGARHQDGVCRVRFGVDVHALLRDEGGFQSRAQDRLETRTREYDIPMRALIARDVDGLLLAGRCISGDFLAHSSYRVTGNAAAMGQAAGVAAALSATSGVLPHELPWHEIAEALASVSPVELPM